MKIHDIASSFGSDTHLPYAAIAGRIGRPDTRANAQKFAAAAKGLGIKPKRHRYLGAIRWCYSRSQFDLAAKQGRPLTKEQIEPSAMGYEAMRMQLNVAKVKLALRDAELAKARAKLKAMTAHAVPLAEALQKFLGP